jgi:hypothetical protein
MKPLNLDEPGCNPISSNCVIWQGPDIPCITLCKGDSVSSVVAKLATELCDVLTILDIKSYDISCFNLTTCQPKDFEELIQFLIKRICMLETCTGCAPDCNGNATLCNGNCGKATTGCPDCEVPIASCFYYTNALGDQITTMQLTDYATAMGNKICTIIFELIVMQTAITSQEVRIVALEQKAPVIIPLPDVTPVCVVNPGIPTPMNVVLQALEQQFCALVNVTGSPNELTDSFGAECNGLTNQQQLNGLGTMGSIVGWNSQVFTLADSFVNMWLTICDMRAAIRNIQLNCCPTACDGIVINMTATIEVNTLTLYFLGSIPTNFVQCLPSGTTTITISDQSGNTIVVPFNLLAYMNLATGYNISLNLTPINVADNLTISITPCLYNSVTDSTCQSYVEYTLVNNAGCFTLTLTPTFDTIAYTGNSGPGAASYTVELWLGMSMITSQTVAVTGATLIAGTFTGLLSSTLYQVRLKVDPSPCGNPYYCPFTTATTIANPCPAPTNVVPVITIDGCVDC